MLWAVVFYAVAMKLSSGWPMGALPDTALAYDIAGDYFDGFYGPWNTDYFRSGRLLGARSWPFDRYGSYWGADAWDQFGGYGPSDYGYYNGYPRTAEVAKENYIRDNPYGGTEVGIRDSVSTRSGPWRPDMFRSSYLPPPVLPKSGWRGIDRFYNPYPYDYDFPVSPFRRALPFAMSAARPSSLRWGGDPTYLRR